MISKEYKNFRKFVTVVMYSFVNGLNHHYKFCATFHPQMRLHLCVMMSAEKGIVTVGHSKFHIIQNEQISDGFFGKCGVETKNLTRSLGLTFIVEQISAA